MRRALLSFATLATLALAATALTVLAPGTALGTLTNVGTVTGDVINYGGTTGSTGVSGASGASGTSGTSGATGATGVTVNTSPIPQCPGSGATDPCVAVTQTTGFQVKVGADRSLATIPRSGSIVAWTISLGAPTAGQTTFFNTNEGGPAQAGIAILKAGKHLEYTLVAQSPTQQLLPYFGETAEFPLATSIPVKAGEILALTVPTWAPVLALHDVSGHKYGKYVSWRSSRQKSNKGCSTTSTQTAQQTAHSTVQYSCLYQGVRLTYSALLVSTP